MPFSSSCLGCQAQKRFKDEKFYNVNNLSLNAINDLRLKYNAKKRKLDSLNSIPANSKICKSCFDISSRNPDVRSFSDAPDLTIYRRDISSHSCYTFGCKNAKQLISVSSTVREHLLMNYKFYIIPDSYVFHTFKY